MAQLGRNLAESLEEGSGGVDRFVTDTEYKQHVLSMCEGMRVDQ